MKEKFITSKIEEIIDNTYWYFESDDGEGIMFHHLLNSEMFNKKYVNFEIDFKEIYDEDKNELIAVFIKDETAMNIMLNQIKTYPDLNFWELVLLVDEAFKRNSHDLLKFRGDLAEVIFLATEGGEKYYESEDFDIILDDEYIEVKSYSTNSKEIVIKNSQSNQEARTYSVGLEPSQDGKTIFDFLHTIEGNEEFKEYIKKEYSNFHYAITTKFSNDYVQDITTFVKSLKLNKRVIKARVKLI